jgi:alkylated DNA repair dioxygenase AlkB
MGSQLFSINATTPDIPGLTYLRDYVTADVERALLTAIDAEPWDETWKRRRQVYGAAYGTSRQDYRALPAWSDELVTRLYAEGVSEQLFDHMVVNEYLPGQGISLHRDYEPFGRTVVSLSLLSDCVMDFRRVADAHRESILLERFSLLVLSDAARYEWEHGIAPRKKDRWEGTSLPRKRRVSVTLRQRVRGGHEQQ